MPHQETATYKAMLDATRQTFENMAFVEVTEQSEELAFESPTHATWVSILIHDPLQGEVRIALPSALLTNMTADMFGIEIEEVSESQHQDIIAEMLNTLAGLFMTNLIPEDQTYQLGLPEHGEGPVPENEENAIVWNLQIEGEPLLIVANGNGFSAYNN
ncbi:MAG: chemotaxis protein CheX [Geopsychrobacter sp.]|nr:chemotaxis protein CheX [Geopsychrobacter sp.]